jgi:hypothetical protein
MRNFACRNFQNNTELYSKLSYIRRPCYAQVAMKLRRNSIKTTDKNIFSNGLGMHGKVSLLET